MSEELSFSFLPTEINEDSENLTFKQANQIIGTANQSVVDWSRTGFKKYTLSEYTVPQNDSDCIRRLLDTKNKSIINGERVETAVQSFKRIKPFIYKANITIARGEKSIDQYCDLSKQKIFRKDYTSGLAFMEDLFTRLRKLKDKEVFRVYYTGLETLYELDGNDKLGFSITDLPTPMKQLFPHAMEGFSTSAFMYFAHQGSVICLHTDDAEANAFNVVLTTGEKMWIIVGPGHKMEIRNLIKTQLGTSTDCSHNHKDLLIDPLLFRTNKIPFSVVSQRGGDVMMIARSSFHEGVNFCGDGKLVVAAAVNIILEDYLTDFDLFKDEILTCKCGKRGIHLEKKDLEQLDERIRTYRRTNNT